MWITPKNYKVVGGYLAEIRKNAGVTQDELAARLKKPQSFISSYERGERRVDVLELMAILDALGLEPIPIFAEIIAKTSRRSARRRTTS